MRTIYISVLFQKIKFLGLLSTTLLLSAPLVVAQDTGGSLPETEVIQPEEFDDVLNAVEISRVRSVGELKVNTTGEPTEWYGNTLEDFGDIEEIGFEFANSNDRSVLFVLRFQEDRIISEGLQRLHPLKATMRPNAFYTLSLFHGAPADPLYSKGALFHSKETTQNFLLRGGKGSGLAFFLPPRAKELAAPRELLLCPRDIEAKKAQLGGRTLSDFGYHLKRVRMKAHAKMYGRVMTGFGPSYLSLKMATTSGLIAPRIEKIESYKNFAQSFLEYDPKSRKELWLEFDSERGMQQGFHLESIFHDSLEQRLRVLFELYLGIKEIQITKKLKMPYLGKTFFVEPGRCYSIIKKLRVTTDFSLEPLPKKSLEDVKEEATDVELIESLSGEYKKPINTPTPTPVPDPQFIKEILGDTSTPTPQPTRINPLDTIEFDKPVGKLLD